jgi:hypothetical protein
VIGRNRGAGCYPIGSHHVLTENVGWRMCYRLLNTGALKHFSLYIFINRGMRYRGWGTILWAGSSWVRFPMRLLHVSIDYSFQPHYGTGIDSACNRMSIRNLPGGKRRPALKTDNLHSHLWADCLENVDASTSHNPMGLHSLLQG